MHSSNQIKNGIQCSDFPQVLLILWLSGDELYHWSLMHAILEDYKRYFLLLNDTKTDVQQQWIRI